MNFRITVVSVDGVAKDHESPPSFVSTSYIPPELNSIQGATNLFTQFSSTIVIHGKNFGNTASGAQDSAGLTPLPYEFPLRSLRLGKEDTSRSKGTSKPLSLAKACRSLIDRGLGDSDESALTTS